MWLYDSWNYIWQVSTINKNFDIGAFHTILQVSFHSFYNIYLHYMDLNLELNGAICCITEVSMKA